ncbi:dTDP-4-dehydrorhamnose 3,5-epimerase [Sphingomonas sp. BIUV-7]|uniref:dTDP-4-dehydrorhamnose 3,5-epimerase n=1 Tax=Sphingomonas natans TaxID=3063330 RepID=A0ABT8YET1_9SPHN|nr:dTDP-4-dehydrorhamnose 3,5-epimerase [Sphingomonas sp. BIUV-7]MDO6416174.1 dTDP-4-dehydrorhamnose 3,5-epimerase [Sphingomonas sp. BIUV-7]
MVSALAGTGDAPPSSEMTIHAIGNTDARLISPRVHRDGRGAFARSWSADIFSAAGIDFTPVQGNVSFTRRRGVIRGMHFQRDPWPDAKIVRCSMGRIWDVIVDLRPGSEQFGQPQVRELSCESWVMLYVPPGFAHGFQTLTDHVIVEYLMGERYVPSAYDGFRYDDPAVAVRWPEPISSISASDLKWAPLAGRVSGFGSNDQ